MGAPKSIKPNTGLKGMDIVLSNLNKEIKAIEGRTMKGLIQGAIIIHTDMEKTPPLIPIDTGNLRASWFTSTFREGRKFGLTIGFGANYALFVHEMIGPAKPGWKYGPGKGKKRWYIPRADAGPKFFEASLKRNKDLVLKEIADNAAIK